MTDEEYKNFLAAIAGKHLKTRPPYINKEDDLGKILESVYATARLLKLVRDIDDPDLLSYLLKRLRDSPVRKAINQMEAAGILEALDDVPKLILGELRLSGISYTIL